MNFKDERSGSKGVNHMTKAKKWGNSLAIRIPSQFAKKLGVDNGSKIELQLFNQSMVIKPVKTKPTLEDLLEQAKGKTNPHLDYDWVVPEGKEMV